MSNSNFSFQHPHKFCGFASVYFHRIPAKLRWSQKCWDTFTGFLLAKGRIYFRNFYCWRPVQKKAETEIVWETVQKVCHLEHWECSCGRLKLVIVWFGDKLKFHDWSPFPGLVLNMQKSPTCSPTVVKITKIITCRQGGYVHFGVSSDAVTWELNFHCVCLYQCMIGHWCA